MPKCAAEPGGKRPLQPTRRGKLEDTQPDSAPRIYPCEGGLTARFGVLQVPVGGGEAGAEVGVGARYRSWVTRQRPKTSAVGLQGPPLPHLGCDEPQSVECDPASTADPPSLVLAALLPQPRPDNGIDGPATTESGFTHGLFVLESGRWVCQTPCKGKHQEGRT